MGKKIFSSFQICHNQFFYWKIIGSMETAVCPIFAKLVLDFFAVCSLVPNRLRHMRCVITRARLCTCLKHWRHAKKSTPCLIKRASRCATDRMSKTTMFFIFHFLYNTDLMRKSCVIISYLIGSVVKTVLYLHFLYTKDDRLPQIKKKHE